MDATRYERVRDIFHDAIGLARAERVAFVEKACGDDVALRSEVLSLLARVEDSEAPMTTSPGARLRKRVEEIASEAESAAVDAQQALPERIGNCVVVRCLGEGGMGVVYEAEQQAPRRRVAVKVMRADFGSSSLASRFRREAELLGRLEHPGIARVYEAGHARPWGPAGPEVPYLVMELVDGTPLTVHAARTNLSIAGRLELIARICDAVHHAHERGVVHRDLKPANVFVDAQGQPRVLDFGIARALDADPQAVTMHTGTSQLVGTLPYMSPEQLSGNSSSVGPRSDVYALGVLAYELLSGRRPLALAGLSLAEAVRLVEDVDPPPLGAIDERFKGDVEAIVARALAKEPERRYASAAEMSADIERYLSDEPIRARPPSSIYRATKFVRRNRKFVAAMTSLVVVLVAGVIATTWLALGEARSRREAVAAAAEARRSAHRADLGAALAALDVADARTARRLLERAPQELRDWTWQHAASRLDDAVSTLHLRGVGGESTIDEIVVRADGALIMRTRDALEIVDTSGDVLRIERDVPGEWVAVSRDGRRALEWRFGQWLDRSTDADSGEIELGAAGEKAALALDGGGWVLSGPQGARVHDASGAIVATLDAAIGGPIAASADRRWIASNRTDALVLIALDAVVPVIPIGPRASAAVFTPDSRIVVATDSDGHLRTWSIGERDVTPRSEAQLATVRIERLAVTPAGDRLVTLDKRGTMRAWRVDDGSLVRDLATLGYSQHAMAMRQDGAVLVSAASGAVQVVGLDGVRAGSPRLGHERPVTAVAFLPRRERVASVDAAGDLRLFLEPGAIEPRRLAAHGSYVYGVAIDPAGTRIASIGWDGTARVWDLRTGTLLRTLPLPQLAGQATCWLSGDTLAAATSRSVVVFDVSTGEEKARLDTDDGPRRLAWDQPRGRIVMLDEMGRLRSWNPASGEGSVLVPPSKPPAGRLALALGGGTIVMGRGVSMLAIDASTDTVSWDVEIPCEAIMSADVGAVGADGADVAAGCVDGTVLLISARTGAVIRRLEVPVGAAVYSLAIHPDGRLLATGSQDGLVSTWDLDRGELIAQLRGHEDYVHSVAFSPDGTLLVSGSGDATVRTWDTLPIRERLRRGGDR